MVSLTNRKIAFGTMVASAANSAWAFQPAAPLSKKMTTKTSLNIAVDPTTVTATDYEDICGVSFDADGMMDRLQSTKYLYPKHVEVIEDIAPIANRMVDEIVRFRSSSCSDVKL